MIKNDIEIREGLKKYIETFGTPISWLAKRFDVTRTVLSNFINNNINYPVSDNAMRKIREGYVDLPRVFED